LFGSCHQWCLSKFIKANGKHKRGNTLGSAASVNFAGFLRGVAKLSLGLGRIGVVKARTAGRGGALVFKRDRAAAGLAEVCGTVVVLFTRRPKLRNRSKNKEARNQNRR
jgi:hypothetical protein